MRFIIQLDDGDDGQRPVAADYEIGSLLAKAVAKGKTRRVWARGGNAKQRVHRNLWENVIVWKGTAKPPEKLTFIIREDRFYKNPGVTSCLVPVGDKTEQKGQAERAAQKQRREKGRGHVGNRVEKRGDHRGHAAS